MSRSSMLNEHLETICLQEDIKTSSIKIKSKIKTIADAAKDGDVLKLKTIFDSIPSADISALKVMTKKQAPKEYKENERLVLSKVSTKGSQDMKDTLIIARTVLSKLKSISKDPDVQKRLDENLNDLTEVIINKLKVIPSSGFTIAALGVVVAAIVESSKFILISFSSTDFFLLVTIFLLLMGYWLNKYFEAKKAGKRVIS